MSAVATIDTERVKQGIDLRELAGRLTELHKNGPRDWAGPCPRSACTADEDGFHVYQNKQGEWRFVCYSCHQKPGDAIEFEQWLHGLGFREAAARLAGGQALPQVQRKPAPAPQGAVTKPKPAAWQARAESLVADAHAALWRSEAACHYLRIKRGLEAHTWLQYRLGYVESSPTAERAPAIVLPWYRAGKLVAVRFRFLQPVITVDKEGKEHTTKLKALAGSEFAGSLFGGQALPEFVGMAPDPGGRCAEQQRCLTICEGEINALSIWQVAHDLRCDVLSIGSESARLSPAMVRLAQRYGVVMVWADKSEVARRQALELGAHAIASPGGQDANDLLRAGHLGGLLATARLRACQSREQRLGLFWSLWDSSDGVQGIDGGSASVLQRLASELGQQVALIEPEPGRWITER